MTVIAGAIARKGRALPDSLKNSLVEALSRWPGDDRQTVGGNNWLLVKVDIGALQCSGLVTEPGGRALVLAGEPLLARSSMASVADRQQECRLLFEDMHAQRRTALQSATGVFCAAHYSPSDHTLTLMADKLGVRAIYYVVSDDFVAFASALRILQAVGLTRRGIDLRGTYETCSFGYPLSTRTCYQGVRTIGAAELVHFGEASERHERYFRWDALEPFGESEDRMLHRLTETFSSAVSRRLRGDRTALSFLSGGLDSRTIVSALRAKAVNVMTVNFSPPQTQDRAFAALAARVLGTTHRQLEVGASAATDAYRQVQLNGWVESLLASNVVVDRPRCIWSGDGGSVGLGHVYLDPEAVGAFEQGDIEQGIRRYAHYNRISGSSNAAMTRRFREESKDWHIDGIRDEIAALDGGADGRRLHLFLMLNDQRRHMARHFENIDLHRFEFHLPFYDSEFLAAILSAPVRWFLRHALYHKWFQRTAPAAATVPWQTYPNHDKCPIAVDEQLRYQWDRNHSDREDRKLARRIGRDGLRAMLGRPFPSHLINRFRFAAAIASCLAGRSTYSHVAIVGETFARYWRDSHPDKTSVGARAANAATARRGAVRPTS